MRQYWLEKSQEKKMIEAERGSAGVNSQQVECSRGNVT